jgi:hypothetical protein
VNAFDALLEESNLDVLCLSEHWLNEIEADCVKIGNLVTIEHFSRRNHCHRGVIQLQHPNINVKVLTTVRNLSSELHCEIICTYMQSVNLYIVTLYRSPLGSFEIFMQTIVKLFTMIDYKNKNIIIGGDFNLQFDSNNVNTQTLCDLLLSYELRPLVYFVTRKNSCLDNVFTNVLSSLIIVSPLCTHFSDHLGIIVTMPNHNCNKADTKLKVIRSLTEQGRFNFFNLLSNVEWDFIESDTNANNKFHMFLNIIIYYLNLVFPIKTIRVNHNSKNLYIGWFNK